MHALDTIINVNNAVGISCLGSDSPSSYSIYKVLLRLLLYCTAKYCLLLTEGFNNDVTTASAIKNVRLSRPTVFKTLLRIYLGERCSQ